MIHAISAYINTEILTLKYHYIYVQSFAIQIRKQDPNNIVICQSRHSMHQYHQ